MFQRKVADRFEQRYAVETSDAHRAVQREVFGADTWVRGYTTVAQAEMLAERLQLRSGTRLLDIGAGQGWPSVYLARETGARAVLTDVPSQGLLEARKRSDAEGVAELCSYALADGSRLPFRPATFDAVVHTDTL